MIILAKLKDTKDEITGNLDSNYWVQKSDPLVLMHSVPFSLGELKILDTYISRINANDESRRTVIFTKSEYEQLMGLTEANAKSLSKHTDNLLGKVVTLQMPNKSFLKFVLFTKAFYHKDEYGVPVIELTCSPEAKDLFFCIGKYHYFKYALENVINLTRKASYLLYLHILTNRYRGEWIISLDELRDNVLDCKEQASYKAFKEFKRAVLEPAVKEVNKKTDCHFEYEALKRGTRVAKIKFIYHAKQIACDFETLDHTQLSFDDVEAEIDYGGDLANLLGSAACKDEFTPEQIRLLQDLIINFFPSTNNLERCNYLIQQVHKMDYYQTQHRIPNRFNYLRTMIENDLKKG